MTETQLADIINLYDFEEAARLVLPQMAYDYYRSGADDEITLKRNHDAYQRLTLRYRVLADVSERSLATSVLGQDVSMPVLVAPLAFQRLAHPDGELATARAAGKAKTVMIVSTLATASIEDVCAQAAGPVWFQLYVYRDRAVTKALVERAEAAGASALVVTVDNPFLGRREKDIRNRFHLPEGMKARNLIPEGMDDIPRGLAGSGLASYVAQLIDPGLTWKDVAWFKSITRLPVVLKGIVRGDDAALAVDAGASGIVVSNHGGRQLDSAPATVDVLPEIVEAVAGRIEVYVDGGIRRGTQVVKALALGARAVLVGRPILWGLSLAGEAGVARVLSLLRDETENAMGLCGANSVNRLTRDLVGISSI